MSGRKGRNSKRDQKKGDRAAGSPSLEALEPRVLLSTFTVAPDGEALEEAMQGSDAGTGAIELVLDEADGAASSEQAAEEKRVELVFVDTRVDGYESLVDDLRSASSTDRSLEVFLLDPERDGVEQITDILGDQYGVDAIHIVSHGTAGAVQLGDTWLSGDTLSSYEGDLASWTYALTDDADLLFYGCDLASSEDGEALVGSIAKLTGADVAASTDDTGHAILGGNWEFEFAVGGIETEAAFSADVQASWGHLMNVAVDATSVGTTSGGDFTISHTASGSERLMLVGVSMSLDQGTEAVSSIKYNGVDLDFVGSRVEGGVRVEIWSLVAPDVGTYDVDIVFSGTPIGATAGVTTFTGADQAAPLGTFASSSGDSSSGSNSVTSSADELVFGTIAVSSPTNYDLTPGAGQTETWDLFDGEANGGSSTETGAASVDMSWSWGDTKKYAIGGVSIKAAVGSMTSYYLDGVGDGSDVPIALLKSDAPTDTTLDDFDPDRDNSAGLYLNKGGDGIGETDTQRFQQWIVGAGDTVLDGQASLTIWSAIKDFDTSKGGSVTAYLIDTDASGSSIIEIASATLTRPDWDTSNSGTWIEDTLDFGNVSYTLAADRYLGVKIIVSDASDDAMWFAYDATSYPSRLEITSANQAPINTVPVAQTTAQDTTLAFSSTNGNAITVGDEDAGNNQIEVTLSVDSGTLTLDTTVALGTETLLNSTTSGLQSESDVAYAADGSYVTVWQDSNGLDGDLAGVYGQRFDADGNKVGGEFLVNTTTASSQFNAAIAMDDAGNFTVAFTHRTNGGSTQIYAQRFDSLAVKQGGEFTVNNQSQGNQFLSDVAMDPSGNFVIAWYGNGAGDDEGVFIQRYDAAGNELGGETLVNTMVTDDQQFPRLAMNDTGDFVVVWQSTLQDGSGTGIYGQRFDSGGVVQGPEFLINTTTASAQMTASVSMDATGNFVVVWQSNLQDGSGYGVFGQRYDSAGNALGGEFQINETSAGSQLKANVAMTATGEFVVAWSGQNQAGDGSDYAIVARRYDATGSAVSGELLVNTTTSGAQSDPNIDIRDNGDFVVAWSGNGSGDADGVFSQRFTAVPLTFSVGDGIEDATMTFTGTVADINTALDGLSYAPDGGYNGIDTLTITTNDLGNTGTGGALQDVDNVQITVGNPNAPVIDLNGADGGTNDFVATWTEGGGGVALVDTDATLIDADENLSMVVVSIANLRQAGIEMLAADTSGTSLVASYNAGTGVLTISGTGTATEYQQVLRTVTYDNTSENPDQTARIITFTATDTISNGNTATTTLTIQAANDAPVNTVPAAQSTAQDTDLVFSTAGGNALLVSDADANGGDLEVTLSVTQGTLSLDPAIPAGGNLLVNGTTTDSQSLPAIAVAADGSWISVWQSNHQDGLAYDIYAQRFDADGNAIGSEFLVNTVTDAQQTQPAVAVDGAGNFVVVWQSSGHDPGNRWSVFAQRYDASGNALGGEFQVNSTTSNDQNRPDIAMDVNGNFVVTWDGDGVGDADGIFARRYDSAGNSLGGEFLVNTHTTDIQDDATIAMDDNGNFVVVWISDLQDGDGFGVYGQLFDASGAAQGSEFRVAETTTSLQYYSDVAMDADGDFVVTWHSSGQGLMARTYDATGAATSGEFDTGMGGSVTPSLAMDADGNFTITRNVGTQVAARSFDSSGTPRGDVFQVSTTAPGVQPQPVIGMTADGDFVIAWDGSGTGDTSGVFAQRYSSSALTFTAGDGTSDASMTFTGAIADINTALEGLIYTPNNGFNGTDTLTVTTNDQGNTGSGGALSDTDTINITVGVGNSAPTDLQATSTTLGGLSLNDDGGNDIYFVADDGGGLLGGLTAVTIEASFSISTPATGPTTLLSYADGANDEELGLYIENDGTIIFGARAADTPFQITTSQYTELFDGEKHHVAVSWDSSTGAVDFYIDGQHAESFTGYQTGQTITGGGELVFGQDQDSVLGGFNTEDVFSGSIYDVRIFNDVRTAGEITSNLDLTLPPTEPGMIANWTFDDLSATGVVTESVSGNNLTEQHVVDVGFSASVPGLTFAVNESAADGTIIGSLVAVDPDVGDTFTYSLLDDAGGRFAIDGSTGQITLADTSLIDFESATSHNVTVRVTDSGSLTYDEVFTIAVSDDNDAPVISSDGGGATASVNVAENTTAVTTVTATDPDASDTHTFAITGGTDGALFSIDNLTGAMTFIAAPDFEAPADANGDNVYQVIVRAADGNGGFDTQIITVTVTDVSSNLVVTTTANLNDGDTSSAEALNASKGVDNAISLAEAITAANNSSETVTISFNISDPLVAGAHTFTIGAGGLPAIADTVIIDGTTDPDYAGTPIIVLDGSAAGSGVSGLTLGAGSDGSSIRGLVINNFQGNGILIANSDANTIAGNYIGADASGTIDRGNGDEGIRIESSSNNVIGGTTAADRNVLSGNGGSGVYDYASTGTTILGNYIGVDATGTVALGNSVHGISLWSTSSTVIGGSGANEGNVIGGNSAQGILLYSGSGHTIQGNYIGTDTGGTLDLGNNQNGIVATFTSMNNLIGGTDAGEGNTIAWNAIDGISISTGSGNSILGNEFYKNGGLGVDLAGGSEDGFAVTGNDADDSDTGANDLQNYPVLSAAATDGGTTVMVDGALTSTPNTSFRIEFFASNSFDPSGFGEADRHLGYVDVTTDITGGAVFSAPLSASVASGEFISATATVITDPGQVGTDDQLAYGSTSEFSAVVMATDNTAPTTSGIADITVDENSGFSFMDLKAHFADAEDPDTDLVYTIEGNTNPALFNSATIVSGSTFRLDYGADLNGTSDITIRATDTGGLFVESTFTVTVNPVNDVPVITSDGGGATANINVAENTTAVTTVTATDADLDTPIYSIDPASDDAALFTIDPSTGVLTFIAAPDFEAPTDLDGDNIYEVAVQVSDGNGGIDAQAISVTVTDVATNLVVTTLADLDDGDTSSAEALNASKGVDGSVSLSEAITAANNSAETVTISFNISDPLVAGAHTFVIDAGGLPAITDTVIIDGTTDSDYAGTPIIVLDGSGAGAGDGLTLAAGSDGSSIRGLVINGFSGSGISISGSSANTIAGNYIGTDVAGNIAVANTDAGIRISNSATNVIGGTTTADRNVIAGNDTQGIQITGITSTGNTIQGNYIGTNAAGSAALGNQDGVTVTAGATGNTIGGASTGSGNVISGNTRDGIQLGAASNTVAGNIIGLDASGTVDLGNARYGIRVGGVSGNVIGGTTVESRNVISGNNTLGMLLAGSSATVIQGNYIGTDITGSVDIGNTGTGVMLDSNATNNTIGGTVSGAGNVISGNNSNGVYLTAGSDNNILQGNIIGLDASGTAALGNSSGGISIASASNTVGGTTLEARNVVSANVVGIALTGVGATSNVVQGNYIGTDITGTVDLGNTNDGVYVITGATSNTIGGTTAGARNLISGNNSDGIEISGATTTDNVVQGNYIGTDLTGTVDLGNNVAGVRVNGVDNTIGGTAAGAGNVIAGNSSGITINSPDSTGNLVLGNYIGTDATGTAALGNTFGIWMTNSTGNTIGGTAADAGNVIAGNTQHGVYMLGTATNDNVIQGNYIGTTAGDLNLGNGSAGIYLASSSFDNLIGGTSAGAGNTIAYNTSDGVNLASDAGSGNSILVNTIYSNGGAAIDLLNDNVTANDGDDVDSGPNDMQNHPVIASAELNGTDLILSGALDTDGVSTQYRIEFYGNAAGTEDATNGEARVYLGSAIVTTDASGDATFSNATLSGVTLSVGDYVTATATKVDDPGQVGIDDRLAYGSTSEFAANLSISLYNAPPVLTLPAGTSSYTEGATVFVTPTATVTDIDSADFDGGQLVVTLSAGGEALDRLYINSSGTGPGQVLASGPTVSYNDGGGSVVIGTLSGGYGAGDPLVITFNANATANGAAAVASQVLFWNTSQDPSAVSRTVTMQVADGDGGTSALQTRTIDVTPQNDVPVITSDGSGATANINVVENTTAVTTVTATDADLDTPIYSIDPASDDAALFTIDPSTGVLTFIAAPDFEAPTDLDGDNIYEVAVQVSDGNGGIDTQALSVTVTDVATNLVVTTMADLDDGDTSSAEALNASKGVDGSVSLSEAITAANNSAETVTISFNISDPLVGGAHTFVVDAGGLPAITDTVIIDGTTDPDYAGSPVIRIDGSSAGAGIHGLSFASSSDGSVVRGLMITNFSGNGIQIDSGADGISILGNWIGTTGTGSTGVGNVPNGINVEGANTIIGGAGANDGNVITNNGSEGINLTGPGATGTVIKGNIIGLDPDGSTGSGNVDVGIALLSGSDNTIIGGTTVAERNLISNNIEGIEINSNNNVVQGNYIGTDITGTLDRGNHSDDGVEIQNSATGNLIGGSETGAGNLIAFNARDGVYVASGNGNAVLGNLIHSNSNLGIDLGTDGVNTNDADDADAGANTLQNYPLIASADLSGSDLTLSGSLDTDGVTTQYRIEFFGNPTGTEDATNGEARVYLGSTTVTTDGGGNATFSGVTFSGTTLAIGDSVTATATRIDSPGHVGIDDQLAYGATSEFATNFTVTATNIAPTAVNDIANVDEGDSVLIDVAGNDSDPDNALDLGSIVITSGAANGTLVDNGDGTLTYSHDGSETVGDSFSYTINDVSGTTSNIATVTLTVSPQNDAPTISAPAGQYTGYETPLVFSSAGGNAISVGDIDAGSNLIELSMSVSHGTITLSGTTGLTFSSGANGSGSFTLTGSVADVNAALDGMTYDATTGYRGLDSVQIAIDDLGNSGGGGALTALDSTSLHVGALVVTNTSDSANGDTASVEALVASDGGDGISLREAILASNASAGTNHIYFDLSGPGLQLITLTGPLPTIDDTVVIDGSSEPDFGGTPMIELDGSAAGAGASGITLGTGSDGSTIRGLVINRFAHSGIRIADSDNNTIAGNYIGTDATGDAQAGSDVQGTGITIFESSGNVIGGTAGGDANVLSGNRLRGVLIEGSTATGNQVLGNFIGTTADGGAALTNIGGGQQIGVYLYDAPNNTIGGTDAASANVISGNITYGIYAWGPNTTGNNIQGNTIGLDAARSTAIGNGNASGSGIMLSNAAGNLVGGTSAGAGNVIAGNPGAGLGISGSGATGNAILSNEIYGNGSIGIDLGMDDVTGNDADDADTGPNQLQNFPVLSAVLTDGVGDVTIEGSLDSAPNQAYRLEFFASASADSSGHGEAERYLGFTTITTDATGAAVFSATLSELVASGEFVTATATVDLGAGSYGASSEFSANVAANLPPTAVADSASLNEGASVLINLVGNDTDPDNALDLSSIAITSGPANGTLVDNGDGTLTYSHDGSETVGDSFSYTIDDASGATSNVASVTLTVNPINDAPTALNDTAIVDEGASVVINLSGNDTDPDSALDLTSIVITSAPANGTLVDNGDGTLTYSHDGSETIGDSFSYTIDDASGATSNVASVTLTINPINDAPTAVNDTANVDEGASVLINLVGNDTDPDNALDLSSIVITSGPANGTLVDNGDGTLTYSHDGSETIGDSFSYTIDDASGATSNVASVTLTVNPVNDAPTALNDTAIVDEGASVVINLSGNDTDPDNALDLTSIVITSAPANGTLVDNGDGTLTYSHDGSETIGDSFSYTIDDASGATSNVASVTLTVNPINDAPTALNDTAIVDEGVSVLINLAGNDSDADNALDLSSIVITSGPANGTLVDNGDGTLTYSHDGSETIGDSFSYTIDDASGATSNVASVTLTINPINDAPTAVNDTANVDEGASVLINLVGNDTDPDNALDLSSIVITSGPANGTLVDNGDGTLTYSHDGSETVGDSFSYTIDDASGATSNVASVTLTIGPINTPPTAVNDTANVDEGASVLINLVGNDTDPDSALDLSSIAITSGPANGTLVDNGDGTLTYSHDGSETVGDSFSYTIDDASGATSNVASVTLTVNPINDAPTALNDTAIVDEGSSVLINLVGNDSDPDNTLDLSSIVITSAPANGTLVDNGDGTLTYSHDGSETVGDSFSYTIDDASGATSNVASVTLTINPVNDAPTAVNDTAIVDEGASVLINLSGNDTDPDSALDLSSIVITSGPANGTLVDNGDGTLTYSHDGTETVGDSFSYTIDDASGATSNVASVTLTINPINDAPTAVNDTANVDEGASVLINLVGNDTDPDNALDLSSIVITSAPANGTLVDNGDGTLTYSHDGSETIGDSFSYTIDDASGATSNVASVTLTIGPINTPPTAVNDTANVDEGASVLINLVGNDTDPDSALILSSIVITSGPANGTLVDNGDGTLTYSHDGSETVGDSFSYTIDDASGATSNVASVTLTVNPINDAPTAVDDTANVDEGASVVINLSGNDTDPDSALDLTSIVITSAPANGTLVDNGDGTLTYSHDGSETVGDSFSYTIDDASGATSNVASVTLTINPINDAPTAANDTANVDEGASVLINLVGNDTDPDNPLDLSSIVITSGPANGTLVDNGDGTLAYSHDGSETVGDSFSYTIDDASGATSNVASVTLTINPVNDAPTAVDDTAIVDEGASVVINLSGNDTDPDNALDLSSIVITSGPANGTLVDNGDGTLTYSHDGSETVGDSFSYTIDDASGATSNVASVTLTINPINDAPTAVDDTANVDEGASILINLVGNDTDPDSALDLSSIAITSGPANGTLVDNGDGTLTYSHDGSETVGDSFSYTIDDASGATSNVASVTLTVNPINDAPTALNDTAIVDEGASVVINLSGNDTDPDSALDLTSIVITSAPANGTLVDNGDGTLTYSHDGSETIGDSFSYTIDDASGATSNVASVTLTINPINDAPTAVNDTANVDEGASVLINLVGNDTDPDNALDLSSIVITSGPANGTLVDNGDGTLTYSHDGSETIGDSFSYTIDDASGATSNVASVTLTVNPVNDAPTALNDTAIVDEGTSVLINLVGNDTDPDNALDLSSIVITSAPANGTLVDNGDGTLTYSHDGSETIGDSFSYTIDDASGATSNVASVTLTVNPVNDAPTALNDTAIVDEGTSVLINLVGNDTDPDSTLDLSSIVITSGPANGTLVDNGDGTLTYSHDGTETIGDSFSYTIDDASGATSNVASVTLTIGPINTPPTAGNDTSNVDEGASVLINLVGNDTDPDNALDLSSIVITSAPANGTLVDNGDGTLTYSHDGSETVGDSFSYTIDDASGATSNVASVTLTINPVNDAPTAVDDTAIVDEGASVVINLSGNDTDPDNALDLSSIVITSGPANGTLVDNGDGTLTYSHDGSETVGDSFSYTIDDASGATSNVASVTLTINPINDAPTAVNDTANVDEGASVVINLSGNDTDPDSALDLSSIVITSGPANGTLVDNGDGTLTYSHDGSETVGDSFSYTIDDASGATSNVASVTLTINPINDAPTAANDTANVDEGASVLINLVDNDTDPDNALDLSSIVITSAPANGTLVDNGDGTLTYSHDGSETVGDSFSYTIDDASGATSNVASVTLTVNPINDAPSISDQFFSVNENTAAGTPVGSILASDPDTGDSLVFAIASGNVGGAFAIDPTSGDLFVANSSALDFESNPTIDLMVRAEDSSGSSSMAQVRVNVLDINEAVTISAPTRVDLVEGQVAIFSSAAGTAISISDPDAATAMMEATVDAPSGTFTLGSSIGLSFIVGDGIDDPTITFRGTATDVATALDGLVYTPTGIGSTNLTIEVVDLAPGGVSAQSVVSVNTSASASPVSPSPALSNLSDLNLDPDPEPEPDSGSAPTDTTEPSEENVTATEKESRASTTPWLDIQDASPETGSRAYGSGHLRIRAANVTSTSERIGASPLTAEMRELERNPYEQNEIVMRPSPEDVLAESLDRMRRDVMDDAARDGEEEDLWMRPALQSVALAAMTGLQFLALRAGSLLAMALSWVPMWRRADPLMILSLSEEERRDLQDSMRRADSGEQDLDAMLDGRGETHEDDEEEDEEPSA